MIKGFCSGTFAIPHIGHVLFLNECKRLCDHLTVVIANDEETLAKKGRIDIPLPKRLEFFQSLKCIDELIISRGTKVDLQYIYLCLKWYKIRYYFVNEDAFDLEVRKVYCKNNNIDLIVLSRMGNNSGISSTILENKIV